MLKDYSGEVLPAARLKGLRTPAGDERDRCVGPASAKDSPDARDGYSGNCPRNSGRWRCAEEKLIVFSSIESLIERGARMDGNHGGVNLRGDAGFGANVAEVSGDAVAQVDGGGGKAALLEVQPLREARLRIEMRSERCLKIARDLPERGLSGSHYLREALKASRRATKTSGDVEKVSGASAGTQQSPATRHGPGEDNIGQSDGGFGEVATSERGKVATGQSEEPGEEAV
jgi:hypothetical protein